jgi:hypothetical protein
MWGKLATLNNWRPCWSEEAVSSELRERLDRWSEGLRAGDERLEWPADHWSEGWHFHIVFWGRKINLLKQKL